MGFRDRIIWPLTPVSFFNFKLLRYWNKFLNFDSKSNSHLVVMRGDVSRLALSSRWVVHLPDHWETILHLLLLGKDVKPSMLGGGGGLWNLEFPLLSFGLDFLFCFSYSFETYFSFPLPFSGVLKTHKLCFLVIGAFSTLLERSTVDFH